MKTHQRKHLEFINLVAKGVTQYEAYALSVGRKGLSKVCCEVKGSVLAKKYALQIAELKAKDLKVVQDAFNAKEAQIALKSIVTQAEADAKAFRILSDDDDIDDKVVNAVTGKSYPFKRKPTPAEIHKAYELYCRRFGSFATEKHEHTFIEQPIWTLLESQPLSESSHGLLKGKG